jgi:hypothetical protein
MLLSIANSLSRSYSRKYFSWYVREVTPGNFQPWAHDSGDSQTVSAFYGGQRGLSAYQEQMQAMKEGA